MNLRNQLHTFEIAFALALTSMFAPPQLAFVGAEPNVVKTGCEGAGYMWDDKKGCANKPCPDGGKPGDTRNSTTQNGQTMRFMCDGFTGKWDTVALRTPNSPKVSSPNTKAQSAR